MEFNKHRVFQLLQTAQRHGHLISILLQTKQVTRQTDQQEVREFLHALIPRLKVGNSEDRSLNKTVNRVNKTKHDQSKRSSKTMQKVCEKEHVIRLKRELSCV